MKKRVSVAVIASMCLMATMFSGCGRGIEEVAQTKEESIEEENTTFPSDMEIQEQEAQEITIIYTNDVHSYISNVIKDDEGNIIDNGLRFSRIAAMVRDIETEGGNVLLVDAGDEVQGDIYGAMDEGQNVIKIMNATGYDLATPGNHEFDYGMFQFFNNIDKADFDYVSCNFRSTVTKEVVLPASKTFELGGKKVTIIGITTPETITSSTPAYFQDENGEYIYAIDGCDSVEELFTSVQSAIDNARENSDYVIALGHIGVGMDANSAGYSSTDIIANTTGLDAFIDGHSHTRVDGEMIKDKEGRDVLLTQTGSYLAAVGKMTISPDGKLTTELIEEYEGEDSTVAKLENDWIQEVEDKMGEQIGVLDTTLYICNPSDSNQRLVRAQEMNSGDFTADSIYWYFNEKLGLECDLTLQNAGGIRAQTESGDLTYISAKKVEPFGNMVCLISASGRQIIDALEMGASEIGKWNDEWNAPAENGGFMQVAGMSYTIEATIPSSVETTGEGNFVSVNGEYKVKDVKIYNRETGEYEPINPDKTYQVGGINYVLRNGGNGLTMFMDNELVVDYVGQDYSILAEYIESFVKEGDYARINTQNSPLAAYKGYMLDYENPYGAGRITIIK